MSESFTKVSDFYEPQVQAAYITEAPLDSAEMFAAGVIARNPLIDVKGASTNATPFLSGFGGASRIVEGTAVEADALDAGACIAPVQTDIIVKGIGDLTRRAAGMADPVRAFAEPFATAWPYEFQNRALQALVALSGAASMSGNVLDISALSGDAAKFTTGTAVDAAGKLGDKADTLGAIVMHSAVRAALTKAGVIVAQTVASAQGQDVYRNGSIYLLNGRQVIADDRCPVDTGVYTSFFLGKGAFGFNEDTSIDPALAFELERIGNASVSRLISRRFYVLHPVGMTYGGAVPVTDVAYQASASWVRKWAAKNVPIVIFKHKI